MFGLLCLQDTHLEADQTIWTKGGQNKPTPSVPEFDTKVSCVAVSSMITGAGCRSSNTPSLAVKENWTK